MISLVHKTVYIHIPKCGGQSIEEAFCEDLGLSWVKHRRLLMCFKRPHDNWPGKMDHLSHLRASEVIDDYLPRKMFEEFFTFATIRDPYSRLESHFRYGDYGKKVDFEAFITKLMPRKVKRATFMAQQSDYVCDARGNLLVDAIYPLERLTALWPEIRERAGVKADLPHRNTSMSRTPLIWTDEMVKLVEVVFARDFELLPFQRRSAA